MFKAKYLIAVFGLFLMGACNPKINSAFVKQYDTLEYSEDVVVFELKDKIPENAEILGLVTIRDTGFTVKCNYETVVNEAKLEARKAGGNAIKITMHKKPNFWSTCHRIDASILKIDN
nr:hypothetical protein [Allomuricauda sp.]